MSVLKLASEIIMGRRLDRNDDLSILKSCDLNDLCRGADMIRAHFSGDKIELCSIINGKSGRCSEDCKYCAQSAHYETECQIYELLPFETILEACQFNESEGIDRFSIVTSGRNLSASEFESLISIYRKLHNRCSIKLCASHGFLDADQLHRLHEAGVSSYHHNIETSRRHFPKVCTTHTYDQKLNTLKLLKAEGMRICSGGIIGMGEDFDDRIDMALDLAEIGVDSIPINVLMPIKGTPLENNEVLTEDEILRTVAIFKYINPTADIRLAAGRALLTNDGEKAFNAGASASISGNMLTTAACATIRSDRQMIGRLGRSTE